MKNKTALQELMDWMIEQSQVIPVDPGDVYDKAEKLLAKEENQIKDAYVAGEENAMDCHSIPNFKDITADEYYNETYGEQDIS
jgi:hypothetical protein